jgi:DNA-binding MarR family transcriptional regulator
MPQARNDRARANQPEEARSKNLRQLLLRATRIVNRHVVAGLHARGYVNQRSTHTTLLSNMPLAGGTITETAEHAGVTKQAMGRLAAELVEAGYVRMTCDPADGRAKTLELTESGSRLMLDSLDVMNDLEQRYAELIGRDRLRSIVDGLQAFNETAGD